MPRPFDSNHQAPLVLGADSRGPARQYLAPIGQIPLDFRGVLVVYVLAFIYAELAHLPALTALRPSFSIISIV